MAVTWSVKCGYRDGRYRVRRHCPSRRVVIGFIGLVLFKFSEAALSQVIDNDDVMQIN